MKSFLTIVIIMMAPIVNAQNAKEIASPTFMKMSPAQFAEQKTLFENDQLDGAYVVLVSFEKTPDQQSKTALGQNAIKLISYHSKNTWLAAVPTTADAEALKRAGIISIRKNNVEEKITQPLRTGNYPDWAVTTPGTVDIAIMLNENVSKTQQQKIIQNFNITHLRQALKGGSILRGACSTNRCALSCGFSNGVFCRCSRTTGDAS